MWPFSALTLTDPKAVGQPQATLSRLYTANAATKLDTRCVIQAAKVLEVGIGIPKKKLACIHACADWILYLRGLPFSFSKILCEYAKIPFHNKLMQIG
jgi:hypothetical protein